MHLARLSLLPAVDLGFYKIFRIDGIPRSGVSWAFLNEETQAKRIAGEIRHPSGHLHSGNYQNR